MQNPLKWTQKKSLSLCNPAGPVSESPGQSHWQDGGSVGSHNGRSRRLHRGKSCLCPDVARLEGSGFLKNHSQSQAWPHRSQSQVPWVPQVPMPGAEPRGVTPWCQGSGCPLSGGRTGVCPSHSPQCCQEELWSSSASWKAGEAREQSGHRGCGSSGSDFSAAILPQRWAIFTQWNYGTGDMGWVVAPP